eukprot:GHUV01020308.1.p1 GENE.GHUV01020308.1~~GHUV01020308.1.p1  ORF type:complete len:117 (+),score=33.66 GHUV01020308.1:947-1297(+)
MSAAVLRALSQQMQARSVLWFGSVTVGSPTAVALQPTAAWFSCQLGHQQGSHAQPQATALATAQQPLPKAGHVKWYQVAAATYKVFNSYRFSGLLPVHHVLVTPDRVQPMTAAVVL